MLFLMGSGRIEIANLYRIFIVRRKVEESGGRLKTKQIIRNRKLCINELNMAFSSFLLSRLIFSKK